MVRWGESIGGGKNAEKTRNREVEKDRTTVQEYGEGGVRDREGSNQPEPKRQYTHTVQAG